MAPRTKTVLSILAMAVALATAIPLAVDLMLYQQHLARYAGQCGPHATDIPAHPCTYEQYATTDEWLGGFGFVAILAIDGVLGTIVFVLTIAIGSAVVWLRRRRSQRRESSTLGDLQ